MLTFKVVDGHTVTYRGRRLLLKILIELCVDGGVLAFLQGVLFRAGRGEQSSEARPLMSRGADPLRPLRSPLLVL